MKILVVDDEKEIAELVCHCLNTEGLETVICNNGTEALDKIRSEEFDLAILDIMLPDTDGLTLCAEIRKRYKYPVIMLTAKTAFSDRISGLSLGADDYVTKPFNPPELVARAKAQLRRYKQYNDTPSSEGTIEIAGLVINNLKRTCSLYGEALNLTPTEFGILWLLCENAGKVISTEDIFERVWGEKYLDSNNTVMVHIRRLREKMHERPKSPKFIKTVWGVGYKIEKE